MGKITIGKEHLSAWDDEFIIGAHELRDDSSVLLISKYSESNTNTSEIIHNRQSGYLDRSILRVLWEDNGDIIYGSDWGDVKRVKSNNVVEEVNNIDDDSHFNSIAFFKKKDGSLDILSAASHGREHAGIYLNSGNNRIFDAPTPGEIYSDNNGFEWVCYDKIGNWYGACWNHNLYINQSIAFDSKERNTAVSVDSSNNWYLGTESGKIYKNKGLYKTVSGKISVITTDINNNVYYIAGGKSLYKNSDLIYSSTDGDELVDLITNTKGDWYTIHETSRKVVKNGTVILTAPDTNGVKLGSISTKNQYGAQTSRWTKWTASAADKEITKPFRTPCETISSYDELRKYALTLTGKLNAWNPLSDFPGDFVIIVNGVKYTKSRVGENNLASNGFFIGNTDGDLIALCLHNEETDTDVILASTKSGGNNFQFGIPQQDGKIYISTKNDKNDTNKVVVNKISFNKRLVKIRRYGWKESSLHDNGRWLALDVPLTYPINIKVKAYSIGSNEAWSGNYYGNNSNGVTWNSASDAAKMQYDGDNMYIERYDNGNGTFSFNMKSTRGANILAADITINGKTIYNYNYDGKRYDKGQHDWDYTEMKLVWPTSGWNMATTDLNDEHLWINGTHYGDRNFIAAGQTGGNETRTSFSQSNAYNGKAVKYGDWQRTTIGVGYKNIGFKLVDAMKANPFLMEIKTTFVLVGLGGATDWWVFGGENSSRQIGRLSLRRDFPGDDIQFWIQGPEHSDYTDITSVVNNQNYFWKTDKFGISIQATNSGRDFTMYATINNPAQDVVAVYPVTVETKQFDDLNLVIPSDIPNPASSPMYVMPPDATTSYKYVYKDGMKLFVVGEVDLSEGSVDAKEILKWIDKEWTLVPGKEMALSGKFPVIMSDSTSSFKLMAILVQWEYNNKVVKLTIYQDIRVNDMPGNQIGETWVQSGKTDNGTIASQGSTWYTYFGLKW